jgi:hypothetical protein
MLRLGPVGAGELFCIAAFREVCVPGLTRLYLASFWRREALGFEMIPEIDIRRVANLMIKRYGANAQVKCARRADEFEAMGDEAAAAIWRRVTAAAAELANTKPTGRVH